MINNVYKRCKRQTNAALEESLGSF